MEELNCSEHRRDINPLEFGIFVRQLCRGGRYNGGLTPRYQEQNNTIHLYKYHSMTQESFIRLDGKTTATEIKKEIAQEVQQMVAAGQRPPCLGAIIVGHDGASETYIASKIKACEEVGFISLTKRFDESITQEELNKDPEVDGFIVQLPLPKHIDEQAVIHAVDYRKDVDGFHPINVGLLSLGEPCLVPATPKGVIELLKHYNISTEGKHVVVLGRSNIVGKPIAQLFLQKGTQGNATVTICHSRTKDIASICRQADIVVAAIGIPLFVKKEMVKEGAIVIDVGITRVPDATKKSGSRIVGDVDFDEVAPLCSYITPVPGGVGPMTIITLMRNTILARQLRQK